MNDLLSARIHPQAPEVGLHSHSHWELFYCVDGPGVIRLDEGELVCGAGELAVIPPESYHAHPGAGPSAICLHIADAALAMRAPCVVADDENRSLQHLFADVHYLFHSGAEHCEALLPAYVQLIVQHIRARRPAASRSLLVEDIIRSISQNYTNPNYELDTLLHSAPYCYDYLCRLFRREMHTTPHKYLARLRLEASAALLHAGDERSVTEIAHMCGYQDPLYFSRMFKRMYGLSPREYAKQSAAE